MTTEGPPNFDVQIPTLKSLLIEICFGDTVLGTGTAFLAANNGESHCALITNRHNVTGRHQDTGDCLNSNAAIPDNIRIYFHKNAERPGEWKKIQLPLYRADHSPYWYEHSTLGAKADVVALNVKWGDDVTKYPYYLETELDRFGIEVGPAEPVSVIGFPFGYTTLEHFPVWATGFLAQELSLITPDNPTFLIDCRARQGQSGSPVIAYRVGNYRKRSGSRLSSVLAPQPVWEFLGIYSARLNQESDLGRVWHVSAIADVLATAAADARRRELLQQSRQQISEASPPPAQITPPKAM